MKENIWRNRRLGKKEGRYYRAIGLFYLNYLSNESERETILNSKRKKEKKNQNSPRTSQYFKGQINLRFNLYVIEQKFILPSLQILGS